jgi:hypothetical protein
MTNEERVIRLAVLNEIQDRFPDSSDSRAVWGLIERMLAEAANETGMAYVQDWYAGIPLKPGEVVAFVNDGSERKVVLRRVSQAGPACPTKSN